MSLNDTSTDSKSLFASKTFWFNILGPVLAWAGAKYGLSMDQETQMEIIAGVLAIGNVAVRLFSNQAVHIVAPK